MQGENTHQEPTDMDVGHILAAVNDRTEYKDLTLDRVIQENNCYMIYRDGKYITTINVDAHQTTDELRETLENYTRA